MKKERNGRCRPKFSLIKMMFYGKKFDYKNKNLGFDDVKIFAKCKQFIITVSQAFNTNNRSASHIDFGDQIKFHNCIELYRSYAQFSFYLFVNVSSSFGIIVLICTYSHFKINVYFIIHVIFLYLFYQNNLSHPIGKQNFICISFRIFKLGENLRAF